MAQRCLQPYLALSATAAFLSSSLPPSLALLDGSIGYYSEMTMMHSLSETDDGGREAVPSATLKRVLLTEAASNRGAVCLDGSPGAFYYRPGVGPGKHKWYVHHQGGGWCMTLKECHRRASTNEHGLGSSVDWKESIAMNYDYFSVDPEVNPMMHDWNLAFLPYCDGGSFSGNNETAATYEGESVYFRGARIREAVAEELTKEEYGHGGLAAATDVVVSGCSAGGLATYLHTDQWCYVVREESNGRAKCVGMPDSGFFVNYKDAETDEGPELEGEPGAGVEKERRLRHRLAQSHIRWIFEQQNATRGVNSRCLEDLQPTGDEWKCMYAETAAKYIRTPIFALQSEYDSWQREAVLTTNDDVNAFGDDLTAKLHKSVLDGDVRSGAFLDSCSHHCHMWGNIRIDGDLVADAFRKWYDGLGDGLGDGDAAEDDSSDGRQRQEKRLWSQKRAYPCAECCAPNPVGAAEELNGSGGGATTSDARFQSAEHRRGGAAGFLRPQHADLRMMRG